MKNLGLVIVVVFALTTFIGCNKKKNQESAELNAVTSENVVSVTDNGVVTNADMTNAVPVVVENQTASTEVVQPAMAPSATEVSTEKPSPKLIQQALKNAGLYDGKVDGNIGPKTKKSIEAFQGQNGLKADGKVGRKTWKLLSAYLNKTTEVANPSAESQSVNQ
ncbi:MAG: peptidoglycan-binding protein [Candidatus Omnitrophica bacterium]|nr:peptidoglycan-binding protein [Candidatus Omnitrophota bacterium]